MGLLNQLAKEQSEKGKGGDKKGALANVKSMYSENKKLVTLSYFLPYTVQRNLLGSSISSSAKRLRYLCSESMIIQ